jgi:hypothetical protein
MAHGCFRPEISPDFRFQGGNYGGQKSNGELVGNFQKNEECRLNTVWAMSL